MVIIFGRLEANTRYRSLLGTFLRSQQVQNPVVSLAVNPCIDYRYTSTNHSNTGGLELLVSTARLSY